MRPHPDIGRLGDNPPSRAATTALIALLAWLPLQTPVSLLAFQYGNIGADAARAMLLAKDVLVAMLLVVFVVVGRSRIRFRWFDWAAAGYLIVVGAYSIGPYLLGAGLPVPAVVASARQFLMPIELYAVGRAAFAAGARPRAVVSAVIIVGTIAALVTVGTYILLPPEFWQTTMDLVTFERVVQGLPNARSLWDISVLGHYGVGDVALFGRAVAPFTHPVGTAHYFVLPALLAATAGFAYVGRAPRGMVVAIVAVAGLFAAAIVVPISRSAWIAAGGGLLLVGFLYRRFVPAVAAAAIVGLFLVTVPPFSLSVRSAVSGTDSSVAGHAEAIDRGVDTVADNPFGLGMGQSDQFGDAYTQSAGDPDVAAAAIGENLYLAILVAVGPIGLALFVAWLAGLVATLNPGWRPPPDRWPFVALVVVLLVLALTALTASSLMRFTTSASIWMLAGVLAGAALVDPDGPRAPLSPYTSGDE